MSLQIVVISDTGDVLEKLDSLPARCGLRIKAVASAERYPHKLGADHTICVIIDLPDREGLSALETLRNRGVLAPAIVVAGTDARLPPETLCDCGALDVLERPADKRALLGWIQCVCAANLAIAKARTELLSAA